MDAIGAALPLVIWSMACFVAGYFFALWRISLPAVKRRQGARPRKSDGPQK
jgi:hypothetical protein